MRNLVYASNLKKLTSKERLKLGGVDYMINKVRIGIAISKQLNHKSNYTYKWRLYLNIDRFYTKFGTCSLLNKGLDRIRIASSATFKTKIGLLIFRNCMKI